MLCWTIERAVKLCCLSQWFSFRSTNTVFPSVAGAGCLCWCAFTSFPFRDINILLTGDTVYMDLFWQVPPFIVYALFYMLLDDLCAVNMLRPCYALWIRWCGILSIIMQASCCYVLQFRFLLCDRVLVVLYAHLKLMQLVVMTCLILCMVIVNVWFMCTVFCTMHLPLSTLVKCNVLLS